MSRNNSRNNSIDLSRSRTSSWDNRRSNSLGSIETIDIETNETIAKVKTSAIKIISNNNDNKKRNRDVYIDIENPCKVPTPTQMSFLEKCMKSDILWLKSKTKYK
jgi:hypothetical protein